MKKSERLLAATVIATAAFTGNASAITALTIIASAANNQLGDLTL